MSNSEKIDFHQFLSSGFIFSAEDGFFFLSWGEKTQIGSSKWALARQNKGARQGSQGRKTPGIVYAPDFFLSDSKPWWQFPSFVQFSRSELIAQLTEYLNSSSEPELEGSQLTWSKPCFETFKSTFFEIQRLIKIGCFRKAVPVTFTQAEFKLNLKTKAFLLRNLLVHTKNFPVFIYGLWNEDEGILGASPEVLFEQTENRIKTAALAGTRVRSSNSAHKQKSLLEDPKQLSEHQIVVEDICSSLRNLGELQVGKTVELELPHLIHLYTPVEVQLIQPAETDCQFFQYVATSLHPTAALGVFPRASGASWLREQKKIWDRRRFGAPFGLVLGNADQKSRCIVSIRNLQWKDVRIEIGAGCGIIQSSTLEAEWEELLNKISSVKKMFQIS